MQLRKKRSETFQQFRSRIWQKYYRHWQRKPIYCPALNQKVYFTKEGWEHITGPYKPRPHSEIYRRVYLLRYVRSIINRSRTIQSVRIYKNEIFYGFISIEELQGFLRRGDTFRKVKILIKEKKTDKSTFYSVMKYSS